MTQFSVYQVKLPSVPFNYDLTQKYLLGYNFKIWLPLVYVVILLCLDKYFPFFSAFPSFFFH